MAVLSIGWKKPNHTWTPKRTHWKQISHTYWKNKNKENRWTNKEREITYLGSLVPANKEREREIGILSTWTPGIAMYERGRETIRCNVNVGSQKKNWNVGSRRKSICHFFNFLMWNKQNDVILDTSNAPNDVVFGHNSNTWMLENERSKLIKKV